jgi:hypothetical protein
MQRKDANMSRALRVLVLTLAFFSSVAVATAETPAVFEANDAVDYIETLQNPDGGFPAFGSASTPGSTLDAVFAIAAVNIDSTTVTNGSNGPDDYLATQAVSYSVDPGAAAKLALGVSIMGLDPANLGGVDLLAIMAANVDGGTGAYGLDIFDEAFYVLASIRALQPYPASTVQHLKSLQQPDGGWEFLPGFGTDGNTTTFILQALLAAEVPASDPVIADGLDYVATTQNADGGFGFLPAEPSDANSTAFALQALIAAGENIDEPGPWAPGGNTPLEGLLQFRNPVSGAFQFFGSDSVFATYQAVPALMLAPYPEQPPAQPAAADSDGDGCTDAAEQSSVVVSGGRRWYFNFWDFFDAWTPAGPPNTFERTGTADLDDIVAVAGRFAAAGSATAVANALTQPPSATGYHAAFDRAGGAKVGPDAWDLGPADGAIGVDEIFYAAAQFGHSCA